MPKTDSEKIRFMIWSPRTVPRLMESAVYGLYRLGETKALNRISSKCAWNGKNR